jgi:hypothetical protein
MTAPAFTPEQIAAMTKAGLFDTAPAPTIIESARALVRRAHITAGLMQSVADALVREGRCVHAAELRIEADRLRKANDTTRNALG